MGRRGIAQRRQQEVDGRTGRSDGPLKVTPTTVYAKISVIAAPGFVGWLEMAPAPPFQFRTGALNPVPDRRVIRGQTTFEEHFFDLAERARVPQIPAHCTKNDFRRRLSPLEDRRPRGLFHVRFSLQPSLAKVATHPHTSVIVLDVAGLT